MYNTYIHTYVHSYTHTHTRVRRACHGSRGLHRVAQKLTPCEGLFIYFLMKPPVISPVNFWRGEAYGDDKQYQRPYCLKFRGLEKRFLVEYVYSMRDIPKSPEVITTPSTTHTYTYIHIPTYLPIYIHTYIHTYICLMRHIPECPKVITTRVHNIFRHVLHPPQLHPFLLSHFCNLGYSNLIL